MTVEHVSLSGHTAVFPLTREAKRQLLAYLQRLRDQTAAQPDGDDIVRDLETSLGDQLRAAMDDGTTVLDEQVVLAVIAELGPLELPSTTLGGAKPPLICRIQQGKWFGGLCLGLATRGDLRVDWVRTVALLLLLVTGGLVGVAYLVALPFVPHVPSVREYDERFGAAVTATLPSGGRTRYRRGQ